MKSLLRLLAFLFVLCAGGYTIYAGFDARRVTAALDDHGVVVEGRVKSAWTKSRRGRRKYYLEVQYPIAERRAPTESIRVSEEIYAAHADEQDNVTLDRVDVRFLPEEPDEVRVVGYDENPWILIGLGALLVVIGLFGLGKTVLRRLRG